MIVVDCSVVVDILVHGDALLSPAMNAANWQAPSHLDVEVVSALRSLVLGGHVSRARARDALHDYADLSVQTWPTGHAARLRVLDLADHFTAYDAAYVVLAQALSAPLVTRDARLALAAEWLVDVRLAPR